MRKLLLFLVVLVIFGCKEKSEDFVPMDFGYDYYPLEVGQYRIYSVTNTFYKNDIPETSQFQMREVVTDSFLDQTNVLSYRIVRSVRDNENSDWVNDSVMVVTKTKTNVILTKDNTKYVKMIFPVKDRSYWIGDAYNSHVISDWSPLTKDKDPYTFSNVDMPFEYEGFTFTNTATIIQGKPKYGNAVQYDDRKEVYAKGIGRVYRLFNRVVFCNFNNTQCTYNTGFKLNGHERHEILIAHGKE